MRQSRKLEHIQWAVELPDGPLRSGLEDIRFVHNALPECDFADVSLATEVFGCTLQAPVLINAITGGNPGVLEINRQLAKAARVSGFGIAVGSQTGGLLEPHLAETFKVVRAENPDGVVIANVGAEVKPELALRAVEMIGANALQLHLNVPQELAMPEGDRNFSGISQNIQEIVRLSSVPVIVKEVGFGISRETLNRLKDLGVHWVDVGGAGGTNFVAIEKQRGSGGAVPVEWGIATAAALTEVVWEGGLKVIGSGGIRSPLESVKALALGASLVGIAGLWLKTLVQQSYSGLVQLMEQFKEDLRVTMLLLGARTVADLHKTPLVISGETGEWLRERGVETWRWAQRS